MVFKLFPQPSEEIFTPFKFDVNNNCYSRYVNVNGERKLISIFYDKKLNDIKVSGCKRETILGDNLPNRNLINEYLSDSECLVNFKKYVNDNIIVPTYSLSLLESTIKTIIKQIITAKQAKILFSNFIRIYYDSNFGFYSFPSLSKLKKINENDLIDMGLGFKSERICNIVKTYSKCDTFDIDRITGIGEWSKSIINMEVQKNYLYYPYWDKSIDKINEVCKLNLRNIKNNNLLSSLYIYGASYVENNV